MNCVYIFIVFTYPIFLTSMYNRHASNVGWWGSIHHLDQLTLLANIEDHKLVPEFNKITRLLKLEKQTIQQDMDTLRNLKFKIYLSKLNSFRFRVGFTNRLKEVINYHGNSRPISVYVTLNDLSMSVNSFLHIHQLYGIRMRSGYDHDATKGGYLNIICNMVIGIIALSRKMHYRAVEWTEPIAGVHTEQKDQHFIHLLSVLYSVTIQEHNRVLFKSQSSKYSSTELYQTYTNLYSEPIRSRSNQINVMDRRNVAYPPKFSDLLDRSSLHSRFTDLCKGNKLQTRQTQGALKCYYDQFKHSYFYLKPLKVEQLSDNPPITQFYDILGNKTINYLKAFKEVLINPKMLYGEHKNYLGFEDVATYARRNMQNHVYENYPQFGAMSEYLTGLKIRNIPGPLLWAEYTYGRMVGVHEDTAGEPGNFDGLVTLLTKGEMLAALMFYIDTPDEGGQTSFLQAGVRAQAVIGSAVFWMTSFRNGSRRQDVHHAGCPILHGNKIVMITPIWYNANWNYYKCSLKPYE